MIKNTSYRRLEAGRSTRKPDPWSLIIWGALLALAAGAAEGQAFMVCEAYACPGELQTVDLTTGATQPVGATGAAIWALAADAAGGLWGVAADTPASDLLVRIDSQTGTASDVGLLGVAADRADLAFDDAGDLWMIADNSLYAVDPASGAAIWIATSADGLQGVAARAGNLISVEGPFHDWRLVEVDKSSGETSWIADLTGFNLSYFEALDFDRAGDLWISGSSTFPITPMVPYTRLFRVAGLESGVAEMLFGYDPLAGQFYPSLALHWLPANVEIPTLDRAGIVTLVLVLGVAGLAVLRRRG